MKHSIVIADDHPLIATAIRAIIEQFPDFRVLYEVENGQMLMDKLKDGAEIPDIVLLDMSMPIMDGKETAIWLKSTYPQIKIIANTVQNDIKSFVSMFEAGALGYLTKTTPPKELINALRTVVQNKTHYPEWAQNTLQALYPFSQVSPSMFNEEESRFLKFFCCNLSQVQIAEKMNCDLNKVQDLEKTLYTKLHVNSSNALVHFAQVNNLIDESL